MKTCLLLFQKKIYHAVIAIMVSSIKGKGLPSIERYGTGDFLIHINVWTPKELNKEQRQFFEKMSDNENFKPAPNMSDKSFFEKVKDMFS